MISVLTQPPSSTPTPFPQSASPKVADLSEVSCSSLIGECQPTIIVQQLASIQDAIDPFVRSVYHDPLIFPPTEVDRTTPSPAFTAALASP